MGNLWLKHNGKRVYFVNFGACDRVGDALECLLHAYQNITECKNRLLLLFDFDSPAVRAKDFSDQFRQICGLPGFRDRIGRAAVLGRIGSGIDFTCARSFNTRQEALDWLTSG